MMHKKRAIYYINIDRLSCLIIMLFFFSGCSPYSYKVIDKEGFYIGDLFERTETIWVKNIVVFSSQNDSCNFKINNDSIFNLLKSSLSSLGLQIKFDIEDLSNEEIFFNTLPNEFIHKLESPNFDQICNQYRPNLKREFINENRIIDTASSSYKKHYHITLVPIVVIEYSYICDFNIWSLNYYDCKKGIKQIGPSVHLGIYLVDNSEIIFYNSIGFDSYSVTNNFHPSEKQWNKAVKKVLGDYIENIK